MDLNKVMFIGRLTADPQTRALTTGKNVCSFSLATSRKWKSSTGEMKEDTQFHNIVVWGKLGEICAQYIRKGMQVYVEGSLRNRSWIGNDGQKRYRTEVFADNIIMLGSKGSGNVAPIASANTSSQTTNSSKASEQDNNIAIPSPEQLPTIDINDEQEEVKIEDIPF